MSSLRVLRSQAAPSSAHITKYLRQTNAPISRSFQTSAARMVVHNVRTAGEFKAAIAENPKVIVDCFATWCGPCKAIAPKLAELSEDEAVKGKVHFIKLDVDEVADVAKDLGIRAMPTFLLFENGDKSDELVGANPTALIEKVKTFAS